MNAWRRLIESRLFADQSGQILPWLALLTIVFLGMAGLSVDLGSAFVSYRELQTSTDAATLAGAQAMTATGATSATVSAAVNSFSSVAGGANATPNLPNPSITTTLACVSSFVAQGYACNGPAFGTTPGTNALQVTQTSTVPTMFIRTLALFGIKAAQSITLSSSSSALMNGGTNAPYNVAIVIDSTGTMANNDTDANCGSTRINCALQGARTLLALMSPCATGTSGAACSAFDQASIFTFPAIQANTTSDDTSCPTARPTTTVYYAPPQNATTYTAPTGSSGTYQIVDYSDNYLVSGQQVPTVNGATPIGAATGASNNGTKCVGLRTPNGSSDNYEGTFYAGAIYAAASSLAVMQSANPISQNALIIIGDGDSSACYSNGLTGSKNVNNYSLCEDGSTYGTQMDSTAFANGNGLYPSYMDQCQQSIEAANFAKTIPNTTVYTIAYGASSTGAYGKGGGCATDTSSTQYGAAGISPCQTLLAMATNAGDFFSDATASQNKGQCISASNPNLDLTGIFHAIWVQFTNAHLIPASSYVPS